MLRRHWDIAFAWPSSPHAVAGSSPGPPQNSNARPGCSIVSSEPPHLRSHSHLRRRTNVACVQDGAYARDEVQVLRWSPCATRVAPPDTIKHVRARREPPSRTTAPPRPPLLLVQVGRSPPLSAPHDLDAGSTSQRRGCQGRRRSSEPHRQLAGAVATCGGRALPLGPCAFASGCRRSTHGLRRAGTTSTSSSGDVAVARRGCGFDKVWLSSLNIAAIMDGSK